METWQIFQNIFYCDMIWERQSKILLQFLDCVEHFTNERNPFVRMTKDGMNGRGWHEWKRIATFFFLEVLNLYSQRLIYDITKL